jgi:uncharacterized membrane protein
MDNASVTKPARTRRSNGATAATLILSALALGLTDSCTSRNACSGAGCDGTELTTNGGSGSSGADGGDAGTTSSGGNASVPGVGGANASGRGSAPAAGVPGMDAGGTGNDESICEPNPCRNGGTCSLSAGSVHCACPPGLSGPFCETNEDECTENPCLNGGRCVDGFGTYTCVCSGHFGRHCETPHFEALAPVPVRGSARAVSADGEVVVGYYSEHPVNGSKCFRWTRDGGYETLLSDGVVFDCSAAAISDDATTIGGSATFESGLSAFRWRRDSGLVALPRLQENWHGGEARAIASAGTVIAGTSADDAGFNAVIWTENGIENLGLTSAGPSADVNGIAAAGYPIVGRGAGPDNPGVGFRWTPTEGMVLIPTPVQWSNAADVSADGFVIVGDYVDAFGITHAFRWRVGESLEELGLTYAWGSVVATNHDGSVVVAYSEEDSWIWTLESGPRSLMDVLSELGVDVEGWSALRVHDLTPNGRVLVGSGVRKNEMVEIPWIARLP